MSNHNLKVDWGGKFRREPKKPQWEVHLPTLILWYDWNTYH
jgi:hypothetical protein